MSNQNFGLGVQAGQCLAAPIRQLITFGGNQNIPVSCDDEAYTFSRCGSIAHGLLFILSSALSAFTALMLAKNAIELGFTASDSVNASFVDSQTLSLGSNATAGVPALFDLPVNGIDSEYDIYMGPTLFIMFFIASLGTWPLVKANDQKTAELICTGRAVCKKENTGKIALFSFLQVLSGYLSYAKSAVVVESMSPLFQAAGFDGQYANFLFIALIPANIFTDRYLFTTDATESLLEEGACQGHGGGISKKTLPLWLTLNLFSVSEFVSLMVRLHNGGLPVIPNVLIFGALVPSVVSELADLSREACGKTTEEELEVECKQSGACVLLNLYRPYNVLAHFAAFVANNLDFKVSSNPAIVRTIASTLADLVAACVEVKFHDKSAKTASAKAAGRVGRIFDRCKQECGRKNTGLEGPLLGPANTSVGD